MGQILTPWAPVAAAIVGQLVTFFVQSNGLKRAFENQRKLESQKERHAAIRKHLERAYEELLAWIVHVEKEVLPIINKTAALDPYRYTVSPPESGRLRMQFDLLNAEDLLGRYSALDAEWQKVIGEIMQVPQHPIAGDPTGHPLVRQYVKFMEAADSVKKEIRRHLVQEMVA